MCSTFIMAYKPPPELKNRIESIKRKFEIVEPSNINLNADNTQIDNFKKSLSQCRNASPKTVSSLNIPKVEVCPESASNEKSKDKLKATSSYSGKGNIRRTPAFRCDKPVLSHQSSNVDKKSRSVVDTRVKLFEDRQNSSESTLAEINPQKRVILVKEDRSQCDAKPLTKTKPKNTLIPSPRTKQNGDANISTGIISNGNISVCGVNKHQKDLKFKKLPLAPEISYIKERFRYDMKESLMTKAVRNKSNQPVNESFAQENEILLMNKEVDCENLREHDKTQKPCNSEAHSTVEDTLTNSLRAALKAPLPPGPPPKKPPRTFVHNSPDIRGKSVCSMIVTEKSKTESSLVTHSNGASTRKKVLERSTTEPHIMLKKLENVLLKHQQGIGSTVIAPRIATDAANEKQHKTLRLDVKKEDFNKCAKSLPPLPVTTDNSDFKSKDDKKSGQNSEKSVGGCFESLNCVSNVPKHFYEKLNEPRSEFFVESPLFSRRKNNAHCDNKNESGQSKRASVGQSTSGEPIYAEPYACVDVEAILRAELSTIDGKATESPAMLSKQPSKIVEQKTSTLHYMCTPINPLDRMDALLNSNSIKMTSKNSNNETGNSQVTSCESSNNMNGTNVDESKNEEIPLALKSFSHFTVCSKNMQSNTATVAIPKMDRSKLQLVINQAFGSPLHDSPVASLDSASSDDSFPSTPDEMNPNDANEAGNSKMKDEGKVSSSQLSDTLGENAHSKHQDITKLTEERKVYVRRVSSRIFNTRQRLSSQPFSNLFHCIMLIGLNLDGEKRTKVPYIKSKYPVNAAVPPLIEHLCFPDAADWPPQSASESFGAYCDEQSYSLVITNETGDHMFGYCRRVMPEGMDICLPLAYCILSPYRAKGFYFKILSELESQHGQPEWLQKTFIKELYSCEFPNPGQTLKLSNSLGAVPGSVEASLNSLTSQLRRPLDSRLEEHDLTLLFSTLTVPILLQVFGSLLLERKVLFISNSLSKLSSCIEALHAILYPFSWQYTFIPVLPSAHIGVCEAPTPFIIGLLKDKVGKALAVTLEEGIIVDLEEPKIVQCVGDESTILPSRLKKCLKMALHLVESTTQETEPARNVLISEAFVRMFVEICGHYTNHIVTQQDGKKVFERESFIKAVPMHSVQMFLEWFTETAMFSSFMESRLNEGSETKGLFEQRAMEHTEEMDKNTMLFLRNYKAINKKVKSFGDRLKDWTPFT